MRALAHLLLINALLRELGCGRYLLPVAIGIQYIGRGPPVVLGIATGGRVGSVGLGSAEAAIQRDRCVEASRCREASRRSLGCCQEASRRSLGAQLMHVSMLHQDHGARFHGNWRHEQAGHSGAHEHKAPDAVALAWRSCRLGLRDNTRTGARGVNCAGLIERTTRRLHLGPSDRAAAASLVQSTCRCSVAPGSCPRA